ncbi:MAG: hypothetical protein ACR2OZ_12085 [Verrucomicrobiales bacterium]
MAGSPARAGQGIVLSENLHCHLGEEPCPIETGRIFSEAMCSDLGADHVLEAQGPGINVFLRL